MGRKFGLALLAAFTVYFLMVGIQRYITYTGASEVVQRFMDAVIEGDGEAAISCMTPKMRNNAEQSVREKERFWQPHEATTYRIHHIDIKRESASAVVWIEKEGAVTKPSLQLVKDEMGNWLVGHIAFPYVGDNPNEDLARELAERLSESQ